MTKLKVFIKRLYVSIFKNNYPLRQNNGLTFIYIHINKTGGTSIANVIGLPKKRHLNVKDVISIVGQEEFNKAIVFSVVRNPWDKVVSHYKYRIKNNKSIYYKKLSFKDWVSLTYGEKKNPNLYDDPKKFESQSDWLKDYNGNIRVNKILRFENLSNDFNELSSLIGIKKKLPFLNRTKKDNYVNYYDNETKKIIEKHFAEDIDNFGYKFNM